MSDTGKSEISSAADALQSAVEMTPVGAIGIDATGTILCTNSMAVDAADIPAEKLAGAPLADLVIPEFAEEVTKAIENANSELNTLTTRLAAKLKPIELGIRKVSDSGAIVSIRDMTAEFALSAKAAGNLTHDQLTGLPDKYFVLSELGYRLDESKPKPMAILSVWIDKLSDLVAEHGQAAADKILREVAERLTLKLRAPDLLGRFDDSGFVALLTSDAPAEELTDIADRLRNEIAFPVNVNGTLVSFSASVAIAPLKGQKPSLQRIVGLLDQACERAIGGEGARTDIIEF